MMPDLELANIIYAAIRSARVEKPTTEYPLVWLNGSFDLVEVAKFVRDVFEKEAEAEAISDSPRVRNYRE